MTRLSFIVPECYDGTKLKSFLRGHCGVSYRLLVSLKKVPMGITADGRHIRSIDPIRAGQTITLHIPADENPPAPCEDSPLDILYEDSHFMAINKPAGMATHPSKAYPDGTLANTVAAHLAEKGIHLCFRPVNRLDRDTSGIVVAALHPHAAHCLSHERQKEYIAIAHGELCGGGTIDLPIRRKRAGSVVREVGKDGKRAVTHWKALAAGSGMTMLSIVLETGRTHQIRVHFAHMGYPLEGDTLYGAVSSLIGRQALHCANMTLIHPYTGKSLTFAAGMPDDMQKLIGMITSAG